MDKENLSNDSLIDFVLCLREVDVSSNDPLIYKEQ